MKTEELYDNVRVAIMKLYEDQRISQAECKSYFEELMSEIATLMDTLKDDECD